VVVSPREAQRRHDAGVFLDRAGVDVTCLKNMQIFCVIPRVTRSIRPTLRCCTKSAFCDDFLKLPHQEGGELRVRAGMTP